MSIVVKDRVQETTNTTGTSNFVLGGAVTGYQAFSVIGPNSYTYYAAVDSATGDWEVGYGQYTTTAGGTLVRNTVLSNSAGTLSKISFASGTKNVFCTYPAEKAIYEEQTGETLIDGGPITVVGNGVTVVPTLPAELGKFVGNTNSFAQIYTLNQSDGTGASADFVAYNDLTDDGYNNFTDMGINSSTYSSVDYPIFTTGSGYVFHDGDHFFIGNQTTGKDLVLFVGGADTTNEAVRFDGTDQSATFAGNMSVTGTQTVTGAAEFQSTVLLSQNPSLNLEAATKQYVDNVAALGIIIHPAVRLEAIGNLNATYSNGTSGVGATLTNAGTQAALELDGVAAAVNDRVLVMDQTTQTQNGVYTVTNIGSGSTNWVLTRATDADTYGVANPNKLAQGSYFYIQEGDTAAGESYVCSTVGTIVFGTTNITFSQFSASPAYTGTAPIDVSGQVISLTGTVAATNGGTGTSTVATGDLLYGSATNTWSKLAAGSAYKSLVMNGSGTNVEWNAVALNQSGAVSGTLPATNGGTGLGSYTLGDIIYSSAANTLSTLAGSTTTTKLFLSQTGTGSASAAPAWAQPAASDISGLAPSATTDTTNASNITSGTLGSARLSGSYTGITGVGTLTAGTWNANTIGVTYGGTGFASYAVGDLLYADTTTSLAKLADVATGNALISGGVGSAPSWGKIGLATHVDGTLPVASGGTGVTSSTGSGSVVLSNSPSLVTPALGTPASGNFSSGTFTWPTFNQNTTGTAAGLSATLAVSSGGTGQTTYTDGQLLIGNSTGNTLTKATLTGTANQITVTNGGGSITLATPQNIGTASSVQFGSFGVGTAASGTSGEIRATNNVTAYYSSDIKFKENVQPITGACEIVKAIGGHYFDWNAAYLLAHGGEDGYFVRKADFGVIAQDVEKVFPRAVRTRQDGSLAVDYEKLGVLAFPALIELMGKVDALEAAVAKLTKGSTT